MAEDQCGPGAGAATGLEPLTAVRDVFASAVVALCWASVAWVVPLAGVPILALLFGPLGLGVLGGFAWTPALVGSFDVPLRRAAGGAVVLVAAGHLTAAGTLWLVLVAQEVALGVMRGSATWADVAVALAPPVTALAVPCGLFWLGLVLARGLRVGFALLVALLLVSVAPASANVLFLYAALGVPLSA